MLVVNLVIAVGRHRLHEWIGTVSEEVVGDSPYVAFVVAAHHFSRLPATDCS